MEEDMDINLRDYFAAKALQGLLAYIGADPRKIEHMTDGWGRTIRNDESIAKAAYVYADAMMKARLK